MGQQNAKKKKSNNTYKMAFSSVCLALCVVVLFFSSVPVGWEKVLTLAAGFFVFLIAKSFGIGWGILFFVAATALSLLIVPVKIELAFFILCFGPFGLLHAWLYSFEKLNSFLRSFIAIVIMAVLMSLIGVLFLGLFHDYQGEVLLQWFNYDMPLIYLIGLGIVTGVVCNIVYNPLADVIVERTSGRGAKGRTKNERSSIVLPKMYEEDDDNNNGGRQ